MGIIDIEGSDISTIEIMAHVLPNSTMDPTFNDFSIRRGSAFVNEYARTDSVTGLRNDGGPSNPNHLLECFPTLFPYGMSGFETNRPTSVSYENHAKWSLLYGDKRFCKDTISLSDVRCMSKKGCLSVISSPDEASTIELIDKPNFNTKA